MVRSFPHWSRLEKVFGFSPQRDRSGADASEVKGGFLSSEEPPSTSSTAGRHRDGWTLSGLSNHVILLHGNIHDSLAMSSLCFCTTQRRWQFKWGAVPHTAPRLIWRPSHNSLITVFKRKLVWDGETVSSVLTFVACLSPWGKHAPRSLPLKKQGQTGAPQPIWTKSPL